MVLSNVASNANLDFLKSKSTITVLYRANARDEAIFDTTVVFPVFANAADMAKYMDVYLIVHMEYMGFDISKELQKLNLTFFLRMIVYKVESVLYLIHHGYPL